MTSQPTPRSNRTRDHEVGQRSSLVGGAAGSSTPVFGERSSIFARDCHADSVPLDPIGGVLELWLLGVTCRVSTG
jgi:hypothetical protein